MQVLIEAFGLGLVGGVVPGSILTILLVSVMQGGFSSGLRAFLWSLAAELTVVALLLVGLFTLPIPEELFSYIGLIGGGVLFYFAWQVFYIQKINQPQGEIEIFSGRKIYTLAATNAPLYIFWVTVCSPLIWQLSKGWPLVLSAVSFMTAFEIGWALSTFLIMLVFVKARRHLINPNIMGKVYLGVLTFMALLGIRMLYSSPISLGIF